MVLQSTIPYYLKQPAAGVLVTSSLGYSADKNNSLYTSLKIRTFLQPARLILARLSMPVAVSLSNDIYSLSLSLSPLLSGNCFWKRGSHASKVPNLKGLARGALSERVASAFRQVATN